MKQQNKKGFTFIELLLYISITAITLLGISIFLSSLLQSRIKNQTIAEVEQQGAQVMQIITQTIHNAKSVLTPVSGMNAGSLSLTIFNISHDPTVFDLFQGSIRIIEGTGLAIPLTNSHIIASGLEFQNLSRSNTPETIRIRFTLTYKNPEGRKEYDYNKTFYASGNVRGGIQEM